MDLIVSESDFQKNRPLIISPGITETPPIGLICDIIISMKKTLLMSAALLAGLFVYGKSSTPVGFTDDLESALKSAQEKNKLVYISFSGSDWCGWCIKLEKEVFSEPSFAAAVSNDYELVYIDSPRDKSRLSELAKAKNPVLTKQYKVRGFPTYVILKSDGTELARGSAYRPGGAEAYATFLKEVKADPGKIARMRRLKAEWVSPLEAKYKKLMDELNVECGKYMDAEAEKPENKAAGKTRDDFRDDCIKIVLSWVPKFREVANEATEKAKTAPAEIAPVLDEYAAGLENWIKMIEERP